MVLPLQSNHRRSSKLLEPNSYKILIKFIIKWGSIYLPMVSLIPTENALLHDCTQLCFIREEKGQIGGQNAMSNCAQHFFIIRWAQWFEHIMSILFNSFRININLILIPPVAKWSQFDCWNEHFNINWSFIDSQMMMFHDGCWINVGQWSAHCFHILIILPTMVQIMAYWGHKKGNGLK